MKMSTQNYISSHNPVLLKQLKATQLTQYRMTLVDGHYRTEVEANGHWVLVESIQDSMRGAELMLSSHSVETYNRIVFVGLVSAYLIRVALNHNPEIRYDIVFLSMEEAKVFFESVDMKEGVFSRIDRIYILDSEQSILEVGQHITSSMTDRVLIFEHPVLERVFATHLQKLHDAIRKGIDIRSNNLQINTLYQRQWVLNAMVNLETIFKSPNVFRLPRETFKDKTIILVAAGPSLNYELENIQRIMDDDSAFVVALGSSINTLIEKNIKPHMICTYDPSTLNIKVYEKAISKGIDDIPMLFGSTTADDVIREYKGPKVHYLTGQDSIMLTLLGDNAPKDEIIYDAPVISILAVNLFEKLQVEKILLVGQNFAFHDKQWYASGIQYDHFNFDEDKLNQTLEVMSVDNIKIKTDDSLLRSLRSMEHAIATNGYTNIYNTTKGGAAIEGAPYKPLSEFMTDFVAHAVNRNWHMSGTIQSYNLSDMHDGIKSLEAAYRELTADIEALRLAVLEIQLQMGQSATTEVENAYAVYEKILLRIEANVFYKSVMLPMDRVRRELLVKKAHQAKYMKTLHERIRFILPEYENFVAGLIFIHQQYDVFFQLFFTQANRLTKDS